MEFEFEMSNRHTGIGRYVDKPSFKIQFYTIMTYAVLYLSIMRYYLFLAYFTLLQAELQVLASYFDP